MNEHLMMGIGIIIILGVVAQWLAWRLRLPSILMLLLFGFLAGPVFGVLHPDEILGDILFPAVSLSVGIILFEGGLGLRLKNFSSIQSVVRNLISIGALATVLVAAPATHFLLGLSWPLSILLASILVVSGPTVVIPLLRFIRPSERVSSILRWEGILIDPVGATLAVLAFEAIKSSGEYANQIPNIIGGVFMTLLVGGVLGAVAAFLLVFIFQRGWVPKYLQTPLALIVLLAMFIVSNSIIAESGLMGATIMGVILANQKRVNIEHIVEFKEQLGILLLSVLFIVLAARVDLADFLMVGWKGLGLIAVLVFISRPLGVWLSTRRSGLNNREVLFLSWMAPRGIVAMAVASLFALELEQAGFAGAELIAPVTILVVVVTVLFYSLTAGTLARKLGLVEVDPQGVLIVGAHQAARMIAESIKKAGFQVALVDTNFSNIREAQQKDLMAVEASVFSDSLLDQIPLGDFGYMLALTSDDEVNALASVRFADIFGKDNVYQLNPHKGDFSDVVRDRYHGNYLFQCEVTYDSLDTAFNFGGKVNFIELKTKEELDAYQDVHGEAEILMFVIEDKDHLRVSTCDSVMKLKVGQKIVSLHLPEEQPIENFWERLLPFGHGEASTAD